MRRGRSLFLLFPGLLTVFVVGPAGAQSLGDVILNGSILDSCTLTISTSGTLAADSDFDQLSSEIAGGSRATALIVTTSTNFDVSIDVPTGFSSAPTGGDVNVTYDATYSAAGVTTLTNIATGVASSLGLGLSTISVGAWADKTAGVFPAGSYQLPVTVRCEAP